MGQQPNIELDAPDPVSEGMERGVERRWKPDRPGEIAGPDDVPTGSAFGRPGPDGGWAMRLVARADYQPGSRPDALRRLLAAIAAARAASLGRGAVPNDVEVALSIVGLRGDGIDPGPAAHLESRRLQWLDSIAHEPWPGMAALASIPEALLVDTPVRIRARLNAQPDLVG